MNCRLYDRQGMIIVTMLLKTRMCQYVSKWSCHLHLQTGSFTVFLGISWVLLNLGFGSDLSSSFYLYITSPANSCTLHFSNPFSFRLHSMANPLDGYSAQIQCFNWKNYGPIKGHLTFQTSAGISSVFCCDCILVYLFSLSTTNFFTVFKMFLRAFLSEVPA